MIRAIRVLFRALAALPLLALMSLALASSATAATPRELLDAGRADEAVRLLTPQATGSNAPAYNYLCRAYYSYGDWDNAVRNCERFVYHGLLIAHAAIPP